MSRVLVILPTATYRAADFVHAAGSLGVELAIASEESPPLGLDDRFVAIDCSDIEASSQAIADLAATTPIDAIVSADDAGVVIAARASELIGLPHNPPAAAAATRDKAEMRRLLARAEVPQPATRVVRDVDGGLAAAAQLTYPVVVKPLGLSASRGVIRADDSVQLATAIERVSTTWAEAIEASGGRLLVERFVDGPEFSVEGLVWDGTLDILAVMDKPDPLDGPYFQETMFVTPSALPPSTIAEIERVTQAAVTALGLKHGPVHAELRVEDGRPQLIEVAARTIGGLCGRSLHFGLLGSSLEEMILRQALGIRKRGSRRRPGATGALMLPIPRAGILREIGGVADARSVPGVWSVEITTPIGSRVVPPPDGDRYLGFVFARGDTRNDVIDALSRANATITPTIEDDQRLNTP